MDENYNELFENLTDEDLCLFSDRNEYETILSLPISNQICNHSEIQTFPNGIQYCKKCDKQLCTHECTLQADNDREVCANCGYVFEEKFDHTPEWNNFSNRIIDTSRCLTSKKTESSVSLILSKNNILLPEALKNCLENRCEKVFNGKMTRGNSKKAIVACCLCFVYRDFGETMPIDHFRKMLNVEKSKMTAGLTQYYQAYPNDRIKTPKPQDLLKWTLIKTEVSTEFYASIYCLINYFSNTEIFQHSPQAVAASLVYLWLLRHPKHRKMNRVTFAKKTEVPKVTIEKLLRKAIEISSSKLTLDGD